jgi:hypothetical protein
MGTNVSEKLLPTSQGRIECREERTWIKIAAGTIGTYEGSSRFL